MAHTPLIGRPQPNNDEDLRQAVRQLEANMRQMVEHINNWVAKIQGIDAMAYAALTLHGDKPFKLDKKTVRKNHETMRHVVAEMERFNSTVEKKNGQKPTHTT